VARPTAAPDQAVAIEHRVDGAFGRNPDIAVAATSSWHARPFLISPFARRIGSRSQALIAHTYRKWFRAIAEPVGIPKEVWSMDAHAGGATETDEAGPRSR
jgi:hypothetical protein